MRYKVERRMEISIWIITSLLLILFVPKNRIREATVSFLFKQLITWLFGLLVVEKGNITYPYRLFFKKTTKSSFTFEYFVYPSLCALFNLHFPEGKNSRTKLLYYFLHTSFITIIEAFIEKYTQLIKYKRWAWYWTFSTIWISYFISRVYHRWFFKVQHLANADQQGT